MATNQPEPGAQLHDGPASVPRLAATVILLRGGAEQLEVLLVRRNLEARFMGGAWVFPGGSVDAADGEGQPGLKAAALRELSEETGIELPSGAEIVAFARWITPEAVKKRFDTWFFLALAPAGIEPKVDGAEIVDALWLAPAQALKQQAAGELFLVFPTIKQLQQLAAFASAQALLSYGRGRDVEPVQPRIVGSGETARILLPGDPDYS
jgi:8-oxo-dGTP pyrophosphatase MutT (NUDIX family)